MIAVLLAPAGIAARGLQVAPGVRADPYIHIGRWNGQFADALQRLGVAHGPAVLVHIGKAFATPHAAPAGHAVVDMDEVCSQCNPCGGGAGGGKAASQGECRSAAHVPQIEAGI